MPHRTDCLPAQSLPNAPPNAFLRDTHRETHCKSRNLLQANPHICIGRTTSATRPKKSKNSPFKKTSSNKIKNIAVQKRRPTKIQNSKIQKSKIQKLTQKQSTAIDQIAVPGRPSAHCPVGLHAGHIARLAFSSVDTRNPLMEVRGRARDAPQVLHLYIDKGSAVTVSLHPRHNVLWTGSAPLNLCARPYI